LPGKKQLIKPNFIGTLCQGYIMDF